MILKLGFRGGEDMKGLKAKLRVAIVVFISIWIGLAGLYALLKPISNGCVMTYMYPTYIPISTPKNVSSAKYGLYLYHEGWQKIDFNDHLRNLNGVPVLFIPGNGGSYKQVRSLGAESDRAYQGGPLESNSDQASPILGEGVDIDLSDILLPSQYTSMLDWFAVDLEGEHSAMDGRILQEHSEYVVYAIHRILDQYKESRDARAKEGASVSGSLPKSVILVGHSMGGFIARAAVVHPHLRKFAVETVLTLSTPHQYPPVALQPSLGHYYAHVNQAWRKGYEVQTSRGGHYLSDPLLSHVVIVSISGGYNDYQVRTKLESLDGIVPPTHGFMISSTAMKNVWLSMEHQVILWCNQLVVQVSHTLLSLIDTKTGQPFTDVRQRIGIFTGMLHSGIPQNFFSPRQLQQPQKADHLSNQNGKVNAGLKVPYISGCSSNSQWSEDGLERDLYIQTSTVTVLAMDGRRRWMDIQKLGSERKNHFVFVTNLSPCSGVRLHLWRDKGTSAAEFSTNKRVVEVTSKMVHIPSGPAPRQIEPGSQTEQAPPSAVFWLGPQDMHGFRFLTISVAPRPTVSGRPPPAASMGVGQFFNPKDGEQVFSPHQLIHSLYAEKDVYLKEDHPLTLNLTFSVSLGLLPVSLSLKTTGCGIKKSEFPVEESGDVETGSICKRRCFPPVAVAWDATSGLHVFPNLYSEIIVVDSSPALWTSSQESDKTTVLLLVDPHCSYKSTVGVSITAAAGRFLLLYFSQISGLCFAVVFFALMRQAYAWELDQPIPSVLSAVESNLRVELLCVVKAVLKKIKRRVLVGDKVMVGSIDWVDRRGMIENVFQRRSEILDPPVANVDHLLVLFSLEQPKIEPFTLTRFLVEAESTGIPLTLALNKAELVEQATLVEWKSRLRGWGYEPVICSVDTKRGLDTLQFILRDQTTVIVGPSGVGKSSLINALRGTKSVPEDDNWFEPILGSKWFEEQRVGQVSTRSGKGKHTTRNVSLLPLSGGGYLADTPGFNQPSLLKVTKQSLAQYFPEIQKMLKGNEPGKCSFSDCLHLGEPGCVVKADWERYPFYLQFLDEIKIREEFQLRTVGTKRESDVRLKVGELGVKQAEPRLEPKKHRRQSRKSVKQSILDELDDELDDDDEIADSENPILRAMREENQ